MAGPGSLGADQTNLTGKMHGHAGHNTGGITVPETKKRPLSDYKHWEFVDQRLSEMGVSSEAVFNYKLRGRKIVDARATVFMEMVAKFELSLTAASEAWNISLNTGINWKRRHKELEAVAAPEKRPEPDAPAAPPQGEVGTGTDQALAVLFADHPKVMAQVKALAACELRTLGNQVVYMAKAYIENAIDRQYPLLKVGRSEDA